MKKIFLLLSVSAAVFILNGCGHTPVRETLPMSIPPYTAETADSESRAESFRQMISPAAIRGIGIFPSAFFGRFTNDAVLDAAGKLGFNRIYCNITSEQELNGDLAAFITAAVNRGLDVEIVISQSDYFMRYSGNRLIRNLFIQYPSLKEVAEKVVKFNHDLPENCRLSGMTVAVTPHLYNGNNVIRMRGQLYRWQENRYGIGEDNDMLMRECMACITEIAGIPNSPELTVAMPDFIHDAAAEGRLSCGNVADLTSMGCKIAIISSANLPSKIPQTVQSELASSSEPILVVVPLADHTSVDSGKLRRRNWQDFYNSINFLMEKSSSSPTFGGVIVSPLAVVEFLRREI